MTKVVVMGAGSWGTTIAKVIADGGTEVTLWARRKDVADEIIETRRNSDYLPGVNLPKRIKPTSDIALALKGANQIYLAVPSQNLRPSLEEWKQLIPKNAILVSLIKGLEEGTGNRMSEVIAEVTGLPQTQIAVLSGPNLALEIAKSEPAASVVACTDLKRATAVAKTCSSDYFTVFTNQDVIGTELGGVLKNLIAVAVGIVNGIGYGQNTKASILTRGLAEITRFAVDQGAKRSTMFGLAGLGDLIATGESTLSRNHRAGEMLGKGYSKREVLKRMGQTAEGLHSVKPVLEMAAKRKIPMPIVAQVQKVLDGKMKPAAFGKQLTHENDVAVE